MSHRLRVVGNTVSDLSIAQYLNFSDSMIQKRTYELPLMILIVLGSDYFTKNFKAKENLRNMRNILLLIFHLFI